MTDEVRPSALTQPGEVDRNSRSDWDPASLMPHCSMCNANQILIAFEKTLFLNDHLLTYYLLYTPRIATSEAVQEATILVTSVDVDRDTTDTSYNKVPPDTYIICI